MEAFAATLVGDRRGRVLPALHRSGAIFPIRLEVHELPEDATGRVTFSGKITRLLPGAFDSPQSRSFSLGVRFGSAPEPAGGSPMAGPQPVPKPAPPKLRPSMLSAFQQRAQPASATAAELARKQALQPQQQGIAAPAIIASIGEEVDALVGIAPVDLIGAPLDSLLQAPFGNTTNDIIEVGPRILSRQNASMQLALHQEVL